MEVGWRDSIVCYERLNADRVSFYSVCQVSGKRDSEKTMELTMARKKLGKDYRHEVVSLDKLIMDSENPRHEPIVNEPEIISWLIKHEGVYALAEKICELGDLSPLENVGVFPHDKKRGYYVVAEGNRRICALTLLSDPKKAPTASWRKKFDSLRSKFTEDLPARIEVAVFESEEAALPWKTLRHSGEQGGAGTRKWKAEQITRHLKKVGKSAADSVAFDMLDYAEKSGLIDKVERNKIPITTLTRHISNPVLRNALGLASAKEFAFIAPEDQASRAIGAFLKDALPNGEKEPLVNSRNKKDGVEKYAAKLRSEGHAVTQRLSSPIAPKAKGPQRPRHNKSPNDRSRVVPREFVVQIKPKTLKRLFDELRLISIDGDTSFPFAANYLFRAFIEHLSNSYATRKGLGQNGRMHQVIERCVIHMLADNSLQASVGGSQKLEDKMKSWKLMYSNPDSWLSPHTMGSGVHANLIPTKNELIARWDNLEFGIDYMLKSL